MLMKVDFRQELSYLYNASPKAYMVIDVPPMNFLSISGSGSPVTEDAFKEAVEAVFSLSYALKFAVRKQHNIDYAVMPLEGLWWTDESQPFTHQQSGAIRWTAMIMQPEYVTSALVSQVCSRVVNKKKLPPLSRIRFEPYHEGISVQFLHIGTHLTIDRTLDGLYSFINQHHYECAGKHHEIYLTDPAHTPPDQLRTIIRQPVRPRGN